MLRATTSSLYVLGPEEHSAKLLELREELRSSNLPEHGQQNTEEQLHAIAQAIPRSSVPDYFGFVTGGVTPISARADHLVTELDANVSVHLPDVSIATDVEDTTLRWLLQMFGFDPVEWNHRTLTTGATASNILGLACGRDFVIQEAAKRRNLPDVSVAELGLAGALGAVGVKGIRVLTTLPHSSLGKAASIVGLGRNALLDVSDVANGSPVSFNMELLDRALQEKDYLYIMSVSCSEVNTGLFATTEAAMTDIHRFCKQYGAWLHIDGGMSTFPKSPIAARFCNIVLSSISRCHMDKFALLRSLHVGQFGLL
jgi:glutamate/tyrosine decarboxylase-like PLP-dependent enzyme